MIVYTSATTGNAKDDAHSCRRAPLYPALRDLGTTFRDVQMHYLPLFHLYAIGFVTVPSVALGASQILMETFDPEEVLDLIEREKATIVHGFDPHYRDLIEAQARRPRDISSLRMGSFPSGPDNSHCHRSAGPRRVLPDLSVVRDDRDVGGITAGFLDCDDEQRSEASGFPLPGVDVRIVDPDTGMPCATGTLGEIQVRSYSLMKGYWKMPEETAVALLPDGYLRTGDAGYPAAGRLSAFHRALQGHAQGRRRERRPG